MHLIRLLVVFVSYLPASLTQPTCISDIHVLDKIVIQDVSQEFRKWNP